MIITKDTKLTLREARLRKRYSQERASELLGVSTATLSAYENGHTYPNIVTLKRMEKVYGITYEQMIFEEEYCYVRNRKN